LGSRGSGRWKPTHDVRSAFVRSTLRLHFDG
jgi:hypothetical protein